MFFRHVQIPLLFLFTGFNVLKINSKTFTSYPRKQMNLYMKKEKISKLNVISIPKGTNQKKYVDYLNNDENKIIVAHGPAGTGKTMFACLKAINMLKTGKFNKIVITRPVVPVEEDIGFLPGNIAKKMDPWTRPILDIFMEHYSKTEIDNMIFNNIIEISPLAYMRGRTFKNAFIIADEMQNSSPNQMMMLTTRIGINSKMVITGDLKQSDKSHQNGLTDLIHKLQIYYNFNNYSDDKANIRIVELDVGDVERSDVVKKVIDIYNYKNKTIGFGNNNDSTININVNNTSISVKGKRKQKTISLVDENDSALIPKAHTFRKIWE